MSSSTPSQPALRGASIQLIQRSIIAAAKQKLEGIKLLMNENESTTCRAEITGPDATPYAGGTFLLRLEFPVEFPNVPPKAFLMTRIFHPNIAESGEVCVDALKRGWTPGHFDLVHILQVVRCLLIVPAPDSALNAEAGRLFTEDYKAYSARAARLTSVFAVSQSSAAPKKYCGSIGSASAASPSVKVTQSPANPAKRTQASSPAASPNTPARATPQASRPRNSENRSPADGFEELALPNAHKGGSATKRRKLL